VEAELATPVLPTEFDPIYIDVQHQGLSLAGSRRSFGVAGGVLTPGVPNSRWQSEHTYCPIVPCRMIGTAEERDMSSAIAVRRCNLSCRTRVVAVLVAVSPPGATTTPSGTVPAPTAHASDNQPFNRSAGSSSRFAVAIQSGCRQTPV
jgi:hypothetical protein